MAPTEREMEMSDFNDLIMYRVLGVKFRKLHGDPALHSSIEKLIEGDSLVVPEVKNVCAKLSVELSDRLDALVETLGMSKRSFIEAALIQAMDCAECALEDVLGGVDDE